MGWEKELGKNTRSVAELKEFMKLSPGEEKSIAKVTQFHPMSITRYYASLINWSDPKDPLKKMAVPSSQELVLKGEYDTSGEKENTKCPGLQHKYRQTALILATNKCAVYCRHCFRKRLVGRPTKEIMQRMDAAAEYVENHPEIDNVLVSGGDPLALPTKAVSGIVSRLSKIKHLKFIRIGSRVPAVFPDRISKDKALLKMLARHSRPERRLYVVSQFNHPRELTPSAIKAVDALLGSKVIVSNQTVLLKGVNDNPMVISGLMSGLSGYGIIPYYLFQCRPVKRVKNHFQVPLAQGSMIADKARMHLNGHAKRFKFAMSHRTGKIEILGTLGNKMYFKYHQAKHPEKTGEIFSRAIKPSAGWLTPKLRLN